MATLYELSAQIAECIDIYLNAQNEEERQAAKDTLEGLQIGHNAKLTGSVAYQKNLIAEAEMFEAEAKRLKEEAATRFRKAERFESYIANCIGKGNEWSDGVHSIKWRKSKRLKVIDENLIPPIYMREHLSYEPDKTEITKVIKSGGSVPGTELEEIENINIK